MEVADLQLLVHRERHARLLQRAQTALHLRQVPAVLVEDAPEEAELRRRSPVLVGAEPSGRDRDQLAVEAPREAVERAADLRAAAIAVPVSVSSSC